MNDNGRVKIYFLGSGDIAVPVLRHIAAAPELQVIGIGTQPDRPAGRKHKLQSTPLGSAADAMGLGAVRVANVNDPEFLARLRTLAPDFVVVVSFGQLLKKELLELPRCGCVNLHASLLPRYRGASPIAQCLLNRDRVTGVCFMRMEAGLDTGPVYATVEYPLSGTECADTLELALGEAAGVAAPRTLCRIAAGGLPAVPQEEARATLCRKIRKSDAVLDFRRSAQELEAMVRAYTPWPGAHCTFLTARGELPVCIRKAALRDTRLSPGEVADIPGKLVIGCGEDALEILELAPAGGKNMPASAFRNGLRGELPRCKISSPAEE